MSYVKRLFCNNFLTALRGGLGIGGRLGLVGERKVEGSEGRSILVFNVII